MADDKLDEARAAEGTHAPTVEVDPTNELLDGDDTPLPQDLDDANVVIDESGTRLVHEDPDKQPGPDANLELRKLADKHFQGVTAPGRDADMVRALREEHATVKAAKDADSKDRLGLIEDQIKFYGGSLEGDDVDDDPADPERATQAEHAAQERAAAANATGKDVQDGAPKGRAARRRTTTDGK